MSRGVLNAFRITVFVAVVLVVLGTHMLVNLTNAKNDAERRVDTLRVRFKEQRALYMQTDSKLDQANAKIDTLTEWLRPKEVR